MKIDKLTTLRSCFPKIKGTRICYILKNEVFALVDFDAIVHSYCISCYPGIDNKGNPIYIDKWNYSTGTWAKCSTGEIIIFRKKDITKADLRVLNKAKENIYKKLNESRSTTTAIKYLQKHYRDYDEGEDYY